MNVASVRVKCKECRRGVVVVLPTLAQVRAPGDPVPIVEEPDVPQGWKLASASEDGARFQCPHCDELNVLEQSD